MFRHLYSLVHFLALPVLAWRLLRKYRREGYSADLRLRFWGPPPAVSAGGVWIHACSVGEAQVAATLAHAIKAEEPEISIWFTATTPSGLQRLRALCPDHAVALFPWDLPWVWGPWLAHCAPRALVLIETELWPNLMAACANRELPVVLANGRLSARSAQGYARWRGLTQPLWKQLQLALMQGPDDRERAIALGADALRCQVTGSVKFDQPAPPPDPNLVARLKTWVGTRPLMALISSHSGEEVAVINAIQSLRPDWALICVPRHPVRASDLCQQINQATLLSSSALPADAILFVDRFGAIGSVLSLTTVALLGGTWVPHGGQNPIEIARWDCPIIAGPHVFNFAEICSGLLNVGGLMHATLPELSAAIVSVAAQREARGHAAHVWVDQQAGATARQAAAVLALLSHSDAPARG